MSHAYLITRSDDDPYYMSPEEEKQMEADAEVERLHAEVAQQASVIADLQEALDEAINYNAPNAILEAAARAHQYDSAWQAILGDERLKVARSRLSIDQLRRIIDHCAKAFDPEVEKR